MPWWFFWPHSWTKTNKKEPNLWNLIRNQLINPSFHFPGLTAGTLASISNIPFDVAKSRIQGPQPIPGKVKYRGCFVTMATVAKEEGVTALYRGLVPKVMRLGPGGAIMLLIYEHVFRYLENKYLNDPSPQQPSSPSMFPPQNSASSFYFIDYTRLPTVTADFFLLFAP